MGSYSLGRDVCWGPALVNDVQIQVKVKVPVFADIPNSIQQICLGKHEYEYDFALERRTIEAYNKILAEEKAQAEAAVASVTAATDALKLNNVNRFAPNKTEPLQPQRTDLPPAATEDGPLRPVTPASVAEPSASGGTPTPGTVVVAPAVVKDFDVPKDDPFDVAELNTINEIEELRDVLATFETPKNVISPELSNPQRNSPHEDGPAAEVVPSPVVQPPPDDLHTSPSFPGIANGSLDQTTKHKFGSLKDITFPRLCPAQDRVIFDPKKSPYPPTISQVASSAPSSQADLRAFGESATTNQTPQCSLNSQLRSQQLAEISAGLMNRSNSPSVENYYSPDTTRTTILPEPPAAKATEPEAVTPESPKPPSETETLVNCAVEMGFSHARAELLAEATLHTSLIDDEKMNSRDREKIFITQLVNFSSLVDTEGVREEFAKAAVIVSPNDLGKAWDFINVANELSEMGFSDTAVCSALLTSNLDKISALQLLLGPDPTHPHTSAHSTPTTLAAAAARSQKPMTTTPHPSSSNRHNAAQKSRRKKGLYGMFSKGH